MYWGSVKFFKHVILFLCFALVAVAASIALFWGMKCQTLEAQQTLLQSEAQAAKQEQEDFALAFADLKNGSAKRFTDLCEANGLRVEDVIAALSADPQSAEVFSGLTSPYTDETVTGGETDGTTVTTFFPTANTGISKYAALYPALRATPPTQNEYVPKSVYLTFDGGMNPNVDAILKILKKHDVNATFFVSPDADGSDAARLKSIVDAGQTIAVSPSSDYSVTYADIPSFLKSFSTSADLIYQATGVKPNIFRFPGGSINDYNRSFSSELIKEMVGRGYRYFDWNIDSGENKRSNNTVSAIYNNTVNAVNQCERAVVLMYDNLNCTATIRSLDSIITQLTADGYSFHGLTNTVQPMVFKPKAN